MWGVRVMGEVIQQSLLMYGLAIIIGVLAACLIRGIVVFLERRQAQAVVPTTPKTRIPYPPAAAAPIVRAEDGADHVAAISAAVYAVLGAHRIARIETAGTRNSGGWAAQGRWWHQSTRRPTR